MLDLAQLDPANYVPSRLHSNERVFPETNCYTDLWIELLHARGLEPAAAMSFCLNVDFEGDQWTFFKPPVSELERLYGIDVHEMQLYRPIIEHIRNQLARGRSIIVDVDAFYLPDTLGIAYGQVHQKTSIAVVGLDPEASRLVYFHGRGLHEAKGNDYRNIIRLSSPGSADGLPPYAELVRFDLGEPLKDEALCAAVYELLGRQMKRCPTTNPWLAFGEWLATELPAVVAGSPESFHAFAFATVRQAGAAFETAQAFVDWALPQVPEGRVASAALRRQVEGTKMLLLKLARQRVFETAEYIEMLAGAYDEAMRALKSIVTCSSHENRQWR
jgi:hypothetical protein